MHTVFDAMSTSAYAAEIKSCSECTGDLCNGSSHLLPGAWISLLVFVVTFAHLQR